MSAAMTQGLPRQAIAFAPRLDLRTGLVAAVRADAPLQDVDAFAAVAQEALALWRLCKRTAPLALAIPAALAQDASALDALLRDLGGDPQRLILELDERAMDEAGLEAARRLRARRWTLALHAAPVAPLSLDSRDRALFSEHLVDVSIGLPTFVGLFQADRTPLSLRLQAAKATGAAITAIGVHDQLGRRRAFQIGFDRGEESPARAAARTL